MSVIPGKYIAADGSEAVVIGVAHDGDSGEKTVIYRDSAARLLTLPEKSWERDARFTPAEEYAFRSYLDGESEAELARRFCSLFSSRSDAYALHWRNALGMEGYNYACENHSLIAGCYRGIDNCKNCKKGRLSAFSEEAVLSHLRTKSTAGVYPVDAEGGCRFLVFELDKRAQADALRRVCRENDIPCCVERFGQRLRLWVFFAERIHIRYLRRLGNLLITAAMNVCTDIGFDLYDKFIPCRDLIAVDSLGFQLTLPFGKTGRNETSCFIDDNYEPLPNGAAEIFRVRTVTKGYLADRLKLLGAEPYGRLWDGLSRRRSPLELYGKTEIVLDEGISIAKKDFAPSSLATLRRMATIKNTERPYDEFEKLAPCMITAFSETEDTLVLPLGLWDEVSNLLEISRADYSVTEKLETPPPVHFGEEPALSPEKEDAVESMAELRRAILCAPLGWGKTAVILGLIARFKTTTLILTADEKTRLRWHENVLKCFGIDSDKTGAKVRVRLADDDNLKGRYGLVILADCNRIPMNKEIFDRINALRVSRLYGITASTSRNDGMWGLVHMLCGEGLTF